MNAVPYLKESVHVGVNDVHVYAYDDVSIYAEYRKTAH